MLRLRLPTLALVLTALLPAALHAQDEERYAYVRMDTTLGEMIFELDRELAPISTANFLAYVEEGFYDGLMFHRVIGNFMAQAGGFEPGFVRRAPTRAPIANESNNGLENATASLAMARGTPPDSATSQFFINLADNKMLNHGGGENWGYAVFGKLIDGMSTLVAIKNAQVEFDERADRSSPASPLTPIVIEAAVEVPASACADAIAQVRVAERTVADRTQAVGDLVDAVRVARENQEDEVFAFVEAFGRDIDELHYEQTALGSIVLEAGDGAQPKSSDQVKVHYTGYLLDGEVFDSSRGGDPAVFPLNRVSKGWSLGVRLMQEGERRLLIVPPSLGYGAGGIPGVIPKSATLAFDVELIKVVNFESMDDAKVLLEAQSLLDRSEGVTTDSGLFYLDEVVGEGAPITLNDKVTVHYTGWLVDGTTFDSSRRPRNGLVEPATFGVGGVIKGWTESLLSMRVGGKRWVAIPWELAYGATGRPPLIPAKSTLVFEMEVLETSSSRR